MDTEKKIAGEQILTENETGNKVFWGLAAIMTSSAALLCCGSIAVVHALLPQQIFRHTCGILCGIITAAVVCLCGRKRVVRLAPWIICGLLTALVLTWPPLLGKSVHGATRFLWIKGLDMSFTPALLTMPMLVLFWAYMISRSQKISRTVWIILHCVTLLVGAMVFFQPFVSMTGMILLLYIVMMSLAKPGRKKMVACGLAAVLLGISLLPLVMHVQTLAGQRGFYQHLFSPVRETQYHSWSLLTTLKYSVSRGKHQIPESLDHHIPHAVYSAPLIAGCGEFGYVFLIGMLLSAAMIIACGTAIAMRCREPVDRLLIGGMTAAIALPALVNT
ncbi:MAG: FtsW/RodA/SpoVE family cell cycle protein, partial [Lentisphaeria bacterium]|nr:FtsW/RodA/SpoVE family cell cycle protein [Lentisphaeria bacterium]